MADTAPIPSPAATLGRREFDIVVLGATGLTGQLLVQHLINTDRAEPDRPSAGR